MRHLMASVCSEQKNVISLGSEHGQLQTACGDDVALWCKVVRGQFDGDTEEHTSMRVVMGNNIGAYQYKDVELFTIVDGRIVDDPETIIKNINEWNEFVNSKRGNR